MPILYPKKDRHRKHTTNNNNVLLSQHNNNNRNTHYYNNNLDDDISSRKKKPKRYRMWLYTLVVFHSLLYITIKIVRRRNSTTTKEENRIQQKAETVVLNANNNNHNNEVTINTNIVDDNAASNTNTNNRFVECYIKSSTATISSSSSVSSPKKKDNNVLQITLRHDLSPLSSAAFVELVNAKYYDGVFIYRVLKGFLAQWGFRPAGDDMPIIIKPKKRREEIADPVLVNKSLSNTRGTMSFAGGSTAQVFINFGDNTWIDKDGSRPFATVSTESMVDVVDRLYTGHKDGEGQIATIKEGKEAVMAKFPNMSQIERCRTVSAFSSSSSI